VRPPLYPPRSLARLYQRIETFINCRTNCFSNIRGKGSVRLLCTTQLGICLGHKIRRGRIIPFFPFLSFLSLFRVLEFSNSFEQVITSLSTCQSRGNWSCVSDVLVALGQNPRQVLRTPSVTRSTTSANTQCRFKTVPSGICIGGNRPRGRTTHTLVGHGIGLKATSRSRRRWKVS
jgi:hypothetical protein